MLGKAMIVSAKNVFRVEEFGKGVEVNGEFISELGTFDALCKEKVTVSIQDVTPPEVNLFWQLNCNLIIHYQGRDV